MVNANAAARLGRKAPRSITELEGYDSWKEAPEVMLMIILGVTQVLSLFASCVLALWIFYNFVGLRVGTVMLGITLLLLGPIGIGRCILVPLQLDLSTVWTWLVFRVYSVGENNVVHDGYAFGLGVNIVRARYGKESDETCFAIYPCDQVNSFAVNGSKAKLSWSLTSVNLAISAEREVAEKLQSEALDLGGMDGHAVVFVHGGGFVAANAAVLLQEAVTMAREGATVYSADYPLAPEAPFPCAIISLLRCFVWLKTVRKVKTVSIVGDSAGGSLASFCAALASSEKLMSAFCTACGEYTTRHREAKKRKNSVPQTVLEAVSGFCKLNLGDASCFAQSLPRMKSMVSVYGMLDTTSFWTDGPLETISPIEYHLAVLGSRSLKELSPLQCKTIFELTHTTVNFCLECYHNGVSTFPFPMHFVDLFRDARTRTSLDSETFPRTLLICGDKDPLIFSSRKALEVLTNVGIKAELKTYRARHVCCLSVPCLLICSLLRGLDNLRGKMRNSYHDTRQAFVGLPVAWIDRDLRGEAARADAAIREFLRHDLRPEGKSERELGEKEALDAFAGLALGMVF